MTRKKENKYRKWKRYRESTNLQKSIDFSKSCHREAFSLLLQLEALDSIHFSTAQHEPRDEMKNT